MDIHQALALYTLIKEHFPEFETDDDISGADTVEKLADLFNTAQDMLADFLVRGK